MQNLFLQKVYQFSNERSLRQPSLFTSFCRPFAEGNWTRWRRLPIKLKLAKHFFGRPQCYLKEAMAVRRCWLCREIPIRLTRKTRRHIIDEHFRREHVDVRSTFYRDISFRTVFERFKAQFREGTLEEKHPRSSRNPIYYCLFDFVVGSSPSRDGRKRQRSRYVRVPCVRSKCRNCSHPVTEIITFFPDGQRRPIY